MSSYLMIKHAGGTKSIEAKTAEPAKPYIKVADGYFPLTTETSGTGVFVKASGNTYKIAESYTTTVTNSRTYRTTTRSYTESELYTADIGRVTSSSDKFKISIGSNFFRPRDAGEYITLRGVEYYGMFNIPEDLFYTLNDPLRLCEYSVTSRTAYIYKNSYGASLLGIFMGYLHPNDSTNTYYQSYFSNLASSFTGFNINEKLFEAVSTSIELTPLRTLVIRRTSVSYDGYNYTRYFTMKDSLASVYRMNEVTTYTSYETITTTSQ